MEGSEAELLANGHIVSFVMSDDRVIEMPRDVILLHDPSGVRLHQCTLLLCRCAIDAHAMRPVARRLRAHADRYFGEEAERFTGSVAWPAGPWKSVGVVKRINYERHGRYEDSWYHPYRDVPEAPAELFVNRSGSAWMLQLVETCEVNERGFVYP